MANSSTILGAEGLPISYHGGRIIPLLVSIDTIDTDLDLYDTPEDEHAAIVGMIYTIAGAHTLTVKSGVVPLAALVRAANQEMREALGRGVLWATINKGNNLSVASNVAIPTMYVFLALFKQMAVK